MIGNRTPEFLAQFQKSYGTHMRCKPNYDRCAEDVRDAGPWPSYHQCARKNGHGPHGAWCKQHDPVAVKAKREASTAKWKSERDAEERASTFVRECQTAIRQIAAGHNDPRGLAQSIIDKLDGKS